MKQSNSSQRSKITDSSTDKYFSELKKENYYNTFPAAEQWLRDLNPKLYNKTTERKIIHMKNYFAVNKFKLAYLTVFIIFIVGSTTMPVTSHENVGDVITWKADPTNQSAMSEINKLDWISNGQNTVLTVKNNGSSGEDFRVIIPKEKHENVKLYKNSLASIEGVSDVNSVSISETVKRTLLSIVLNDIFKIEIDATNKSNQEVETEIMNQLRRVGINNANVVIEQSPSGERKINLTIPAESLPDDGGVEMTIKDGEKVNKFKEVKKTGPDSGEPSMTEMTDAELRNKIRQDVGEPGLRDDQIQITRNGGSMEVKILNEDGSVKGELKIEEEKR